MKLFVYKTEFVDQKEKLSGFVKPIRPLDGVAKLRGMCTSVEQVGGDEVVTLPHFR